VDSGGVAGGDDVGVLSVSLGVGVADGTYSSVSTSELVDELGDRWGGGAAARVRRAGDPASVGLAGDGWWIVNLSCVLRICLGP
jgi:hypothetical protein